QVELELSIDEARRRLPPVYALLEPLSERTLLRCEVDDLERLAHALVQLCCGLRVREPAELRDALRHLGEAIARLADDPAEGAFRRSG
ncbi:MAG TPA: WYL domain-containing protein, partial [Thermomicrobiaceae bacterium]|nr:WYL domain-containing protein [Thermomicrobiaceae bacterium]